MTNCLDANAKAPDFGNGSRAVASVCGLTLKLPTFPLPPTFLFAIPFFPPSLPIPKLSFALSCNPRDPIDITHGIAYGGGRAACHFPDPDDDDEQAEAA